MSQPISLPAGANHPLNGARATVELTAASLGGALLLAEDGGALRPVGAGDPLGGVETTGGGARATVTFAAVPPTVTRLRLVAWSAAPSRLLLPASAVVLLDGAPVASIAVGTAGEPLRSAEVLELYLRHGAWKVRSIASGWQGHVPAMANALGLAPSVFPTAPGAGAAGGRGGPGAASGRGGGTGGPTGGGSTPSSAQRSGPSTVHPGRTPLVGPPALRSIVDGIAGPGWRDGDADSIVFELAGVTVRLVLETHGPLVRLAAVVPLGSGPQNDATAEAALRATGRAAVSRIAFFDGGAISSAVVHAQAAQLDSALAKALLCDAWSAAADFGDRVRPIGWRLTEALSLPLPRELRLGVAEELQAVGEWDSVRSTLTMNDCLPLADQPAALLAVGAGGQLVIGPCLLEGTSRAWAIVVERVLRSDVPVRGGLWRALAAKNVPFGPVRFSLLDEEGAAGPPFLTASYAALQIPRTQVLEDLQHGLELVDRAANELDAELAGLMPGAPKERNDLPWPAHRRWKGPGTEVRDEPLVREILTLPDDAAAPGDYPTRVQRERQRLGRPGVAFAAHAVLQRAERPGASPAWLQCAAQVVAMAPTNGSGAPSATASLHRRLYRLQHGAPPPVRRPAATPAPGPSPSSRPTPPPLPRPSPGGADGGGSQGGTPPDESSGRRRRWRIFG